MDVVKRQPFNDKYQPSNDIIDIYHSMVDIILTHINHIHL